MRWAQILGMAGMITVLVLSNRPASALETGVPLALSIDPATIRQKSDQDTVKVIATVKLQTPAPDFFVCKLRSLDAAKIGFPDIVFRKGEVMEKSEGLVHWKTVTHASRVRITVYNTEAPDRQLSFTVTLIPTMQPAPDSQNPGPQTQ